MRSLRIFQRSLLHHLPRQRALSSEPVIVFRCAFAVPPRALIASRSSTPHGLFSIPAVLVMETDPLPCCWPIASGIASSSSSRTSICELSFRCEPGCDPRSRCLSQMLHLVLAYALPLTSTCSCILSQAIRLNGLWVVSRLWRFSWDVRRCALTSAPTCSLASGPLLRFLDVPPPFSGVQRSEDRSLAVTIL